MCAAYCTTPSNGIIVVVAVNKSIAEKLFLKVYDLELAMENNYKIWAYCKAARTVHELDTSLKQIYTAHLMTKMLRGQQK